MKVPYYSILLLACLFVSLTAKAQKNLHEGMLVYNMSVETGSGEPKMADMLDGATTTVYLKGSQSRTDGLGNPHHDENIHQQRRGAHGQIR